MSEHVHPVNFIDKRGKKKTENESDLRAEHPGHGREEKEESTQERVARIGQAMVDGKRDTLSAEDVEFFMANQEDVAAPDDKMAVRHMFLVITEDSGAVVATADLSMVDKFSMPEGTMPSVDDMYSSCVTVSRDIEASITARNTMMMMQQHAQAIAEQQRKQATGLQPATGVNLNGHRRG